ncbi:MAG: dihydromethanopterin reductase (acceptor) [Candidatus Bathyarchaeota archaeon]|nr:dihydromethanopterin reductase (acceptor) [Candidatus Bathyarchaeum sp.]
MAVQIAWAITGAGHFLAETFELMTKLAKNNKITVTTYLSSAGEQVVKMYGLWNKFEQISSGGYLQEIFTENNQDLGFSHAGRFIVEPYALLVVSPASANTVAKIACGIADTLVTNVVAQAQKGGVHVYVVPTDQKEGFVETVLPCRVDRASCKQCSPCSIVDVCPNSAVQLLDGFPKINSVLCQGCGLCVTSCQFGAVKFGEKKRIWIRSVDAHNVDKLRSMANLTVLEHPQQIQTIIAKL